MKLSFKTACKTFLLSKKQNQENLKEADMPAWNSLP